jgi:hypothetical protein
VGGGEQMNKPKFLPGPWFADREWSSFSSGDKMNNYIAVADRVPVDGFDSTGIAICIIPDCSFTKKERSIVRANSKLIAMAPEMFFFIFELATRDEYAKGVLADRNRAREIIKQALGEK